jgi:hypothetical protein
MYKLTHTDTIIRIADGASIPADENNSDYREYLKWRDGWVEGVITLGLQDGEYVWEPTGEVIEHPPHTPEPADPLPPVIYTASAASFRRALRRLNIRDTVEDAIQNSNDGELIDMWEYETTLHSNNTHLVTFAESLSISYKIEQVFILANSLDS